MILQLGTPRPPHEPAALARRILSESRFRVLVPVRRTHTWWDTVRQWLADRWDQFWDALSRHVHVGGGWSVAAGDVLIAAIILLVVFIIVRLLMSMAREPGGAATLRASALPVHADPRELQTAALAAAQRGAYAVAIALLFQAALALLDARGLLRDDPARTVNECRSDVRLRAAHLSAPFDRVARLFTAAAYAEIRMSESQWAQAREAYDAFTAVQRDAA